MKAPKIILFTIAFFSFLAGGCGEDESGVLNAVLDVNLSKSKGEVSDYIFGHFIENLGRCIYGGIWDEESSVEKIYGSMRKDVLDTIRDLNPPIMRFPGGLYAEKYDWRNGIGPRNQRPIMENPYWSFMGERFAPPDTNHFGTDEFFKFLSYVGGDAYLQVNYATLPPEVAADWVEYVNGETTTPYGNLRYQYANQITPYGVKIWGVGNEIWAWWTPEHTDAESYAQRYLQFVQAMKSIDPAIKFTAAGSTSQWNRTFLSIAGGEVDYLTIHTYLPGGNTFFIPSHKKYYYSVVASPIYVRKIIEDAYNDILSVLGENTDVTISLDEWNVSWRINDVELGRDFTMRDALYTAGMLVEMIDLSSEGKLGMANYAQLVNMMGLIYTDGDKIILTPPYYVFKILSDLRNITVPEHSLKSTTYDSVSLGDIPELTGIPYVSAVPAVDEKGVIYVLFINRSFDQKAFLTINFTNCEKKEGYVTTLQSEQAWSKKIEEEKVKVSAKCSIMLELLPHSIGLLALSDYSPPAQ